MHLHGKVISLQQGRAVFASIDPLALRRVIKPVRIHVRRILPVIFMRAHIRPRAAVEQDRVPADDVCLDAGVAWLVEGPPAVSEGRTICQRQSAPSDRHSAAQGRRQRR